MQQLRSRCGALALLLALAAQPCGCHFARIREAVRQQAASAAWASLAEVEADDRRFWRSQWSALEEALLQLTEATSMAAKGMALVQAHNNTNVAGSAMPVAALTGGNGTRAAATATAKRSSPLADVKLDLNPKSPADLVPALAMLKGLYENGKERIAQLNAREKQSKDRYEQMKAAHEARLATIEARFKNRTLSAEFHTNETRDESRLFSYWERVRERQHRMFHTSLKIQHGTMDKVKTMIDAYEKAIAGGEANRAEVRKDLAKVGGAVPEVVLLQRACRASAPYFREALAEVRAARAEAEEAAPGQGPSPSGQ